jgi:hypothetical protein
VIVLLASGSAMSDGGKAPSASGPATEDGEPRCHVGALGPDGITIDPLSLPRARQVWKPKTPSAGAATRPYRCRIVSYADDMARHDCGSYSKPRPFQFAEDVDVDGDGSVDDDLVAYLP